MDYRVRIIESIENNKYIAVKQSRQAGGTTTLCAYIIAKLLSNEEFKAIIIGWQPKSLMSKIVTHNIVNY